MSATEENYRYCPRCGLKTGVTDNNRRRVGDRQPCADIDECVERLHERIYELEREVKYMGAAVEELKDEFASHRRLA